MKHRHLTALIIDKDKDQSKMMSDLIKTLFFKIHHSNDQDALKEFNEQRPQVIFLNLTINQRSANLEILEILSATNKDPTVIFGYNDSAEGELLAHAIESGIHDIFVRPYDTDIISTKLNRFFQNDKIRDKDLQYAQLSPALKTKVKLNFKLLSIDENGFSFQSDHYINKGTFFPLSHPLMKEIFDNESQTMMVTKTWLGENWNEYYFFAEPKDASEQTSSALRRFILRKL